MIGTDLKFDFDDILIEPQATTNITSRYKDIELPKRLPLFTAPMDTVVDTTNYQEFLNRGINVCFPRTIPFMNELYLSDHLRGKNSFPSIGLNQYERLCHNFPTVLKSFSNILIDVANGHMTENIIHAAEEIKRFNPKIKIMVGNIANPETYWVYAESNCIDYIRVGIGNGGGCLTTKQSGIGYPMASLIHEMRLIKEEFIKNVEYNRKNGNGLLKLKQYNVIPAIVADGGMKDYADIVKALALGADNVMLGSIFNKALESCAPNYYRGKKIDQKRAEKVFLRGEKVEKHFRGMSTKGAQKAMGKTHIKTSEGVERRRPVEYTLEKWVENFEHYLRNAMSYSNAKTLDEFIGKVPICQITTRAYDRFNK